MKWFQHQSDSYTNIKMQELMEDFGIKGYGIFWLLCEMVAQQGIDYSIHSTKNWKKSVARNSSLKVGELDKILSRLGELNMIDGGALSKNILYIPKMGDYSDDYTKRHRRVYEHDTKKVRQDKSRKDKIILDKKKYGELLNVLLTDDEHKKLIERMGVKNTQILIFELDMGIASKGYKYKSHYATILNWARRKAKENHQNSGKFQVKKV